MCMRDSVEFWWDEKLKQTIESLEKQLHCSPTILIMAEQPEFKLPRPRTPQDIPTVAVEEWILRAMSEQIHRMSAN